MEGVLRPLGIGEILDAGIKLFMRHWRTLVLCVACLILPIQIVSVLITASIAPEQFDLTSSESGVEPGEEAAFIVGQLIVLLLTVVGALLATAACFNAVADAYLGTEPDWRRSLRFGARRLWALIGLAIVGVLMLVVAFLLLIVPGIWLAVAMSVAVPALLLERIGPLRSIRRSLGLVRGRWWPTAGALVVGYLMIAILGAIVQYAVLIIPSLLTDGNTLVSALAAVVGGTLGAAITTPYSAAVVTLLYFDLRVRKEGLDLQLIAEGTGTERDPDAPLPAPLTEDQYTPEERAQAPFWPPPPGWQPAPRAPAEAEPRRWEPAPPAPAGADAGGEPARWLPPRPAGERDDPPAGS
jgi:MFS family permease